MNKKIICGMATLPERVDCLKDAVNSLLPQVDKIIIALNGHKTVPEFLLNNEKIEYHLLDNSLGDGAKAYKIDEYKGHFFFLVDDDLIYKKGTIERMILNPNPVVGIHGVDIKHPCNNYYRDRVVYHGNSPLSEDRYVDIVATCCCKIDLEKIDVSLSDFPTVNMADVYLADVCKKQGVRPVSLRRGVNEFYLYNPKMQDKYTIWDELHNKPTPIHCEVIKGWNPNN